MEYKFFIEHSILEEVFPNYSECVIEKIRKTPTIVRTNFSGKLKFYGSDYNKLKALISNYRLTFYIKEIDGNSNEKQYTAWLMLRGEWNDIQKNCLLECIVLDEYYNFFDNPQNNIETEYNIINISNRYNVFCELDPNLRIEYYTEHIFGGGGYPTVKQPDSIKQFKLWHQLTFQTNYPAPLWYYNIYMRQFRLFKKINNEIYIPDGGWKYYVEFDYGDTYELVRTWDYYYKEPNITVDSYDNASDCQTWQNVPIIDGDGNYYDTQMTKFESSEATNYFDKFYTIFSFVDTYGGGYYAVSYAVTYKYLNPNLRLYTRNLLLQDVIQRLIGYIDANIIFSQSFAVLDEILNPELNKLLIACIHDITYEDNDRMLEILTLIASPSTTADELKILNEEYIGMLPQENATISLKTILDWFAQLFHIYWFLEYTDGDYYFRMIHYTDQSFATEGINLTNYKSKNWIGDKSYTFSDENIFSVIKRTYDSDIPDFRGMDIQFTYIPFLKKQEINLNTMYTDIWTLQNRGSKLDGGFFVWSSDEYTSENIVYAFQNYNEFLFETLEYGITENTLHAINSSGAGYARSNIIGNLKKGDKVRIKYTVSACTINPVPELVLGTGLDSIYGSYIFGTDTTITLTSNIDEARFFMQANEGEITAIVSMTMEGYICRVAVGKITGRNVANVELSIANADDKFICETTLPVGIVNGSAKTGMVKTRDKKQSEIKLPTTGLVDDYDFTKYVTSNFGNCAIEKVSRKLSGDFDTIDITLIE